MDVSDVSSCSINERRVKGMFCLMWVGIQGIGELACSILMNVCYDIHHSFIGLDFHVKCNFY